MEDAAQSEDGLFPIYYAWDKEKEQLREQSGQRNAFMNTGPAEYGTANTAPHSCQGKK